MRNNKNNITCNIRNITLSLIILVLSSINTTLCLSSNFVSALSYESEVGIGFTFNPTLSINISSSDLIISNLVPGSSSDSNIINVSVLTNASHGYTLAVDTSSEDLTHSNNINTFSSIATNADLSSLTTDNTWGYSYKLSSNNTWSNYNGLPLHTNTSTTLINTDNQVSKPIDFKIGAKAGSTQASGTYTGTINFIAVSKPTPKTIDDIVYMQTFGELVSTDLQSVKNSMIKNTTYTLKDARDEQEYTVAKLNDGKIWMTKNLNLAGETEITSELSDVPANYTLSAANGFQEGNKLPASSQTGFSDSTQAYVYNTGNNTDNCSSSGCYSYYSWHAATAGSGANIAIDNTDVPYSICPKGWRLPDAKTTASPDWQNADFYKLAISYGMNPDNISQNTPTFYNNAGPDTVPNFLPAGYYNTNKHQEANDKGHYWSSTSGNNTSRARIFYFSSAFVYSVNYDGRYFGDVIRCLAR